jgi:hypothetical protein
LNQPHWVGNSIGQDEIITNGGDGKDSGCIISKTSHARCRIRTKGFDSHSRQASKEPWDSLTYDLLDDEDEVIGKLEALDIVSPVEKWDSERIREEIFRGRIRDFIVISRRRRVVTVVDDTGRSDEALRSVLNLMMIQWDGNGSNAASRPGLFRMKEEDWIKCSPEWKRVTLI